MAAGVQVRLRARLAFLSVLLRLPLLWRLRIWRSFANMQPMLQMRCAVLCLKCALGRAVLWLRSAAATAVFLLPAP
jgi:hypothetical protein